jgi:hypothetical protein
MTPNWTGIKSSIERGLNSARNEDHHAMRVHCGAGYRMAKGARGDGPKGVADELHRASHSIELPAAIAHMETALKQVELELTA